MITCTFKQITKEDIDLLESLQAKQNGGGGVSCVRSIIFYLRASDFESAKVVRKTEGDKTRNYPEIEDQLYKMFGCRTHGIYNCDNWLCEKHK